MSTKVYGAYRVEDTDVFAVYDMLNKVSDQYTESIVKFLSSVMDNKEIPKFSEFSDLFDELDFESSSVMYLHKGKIYLQFFSSRYSDIEKLPLIAELVESGYLVDYHYQNQADPWFYYDESIDESQYEALEEEHSERGQLWDEIFDVHSSPSKVGLVKEFNPSIIDVDLYSIFSSKKETTDAQEV